CRTCQAVRRAALARFAGQPAVGRHRATDPSRNRWTCPRSSRRFPATSSATRLTQQLPDAPSALMLTSVGLVSAWERGQSPSGRQYVRNVNSAWDACTPAPLPASRRSTHFKPLGIPKSPTEQWLAGRPRGRVTSTSGLPALKGEKD